MEKVKFPHFPALTCAPHASPCAAAHLAASPRCHPCPPHRCEQPDFKTARKPWREAAGQQLGVASQREAAPGGGETTQPLARAADWLKCLRGASKRLRPARALLLFSQPLGPPPLARETLRRRRPSPVRTTGEREAADTLARSHQHQGSQSRREPRRWSCRGHAPPLGREDVAGDLGGRPPPPSPAETRPWTRPSLGGMEDPGS